MSTHILPWVDLNGVSVPGIQNWTWQLLPNTCHILAIERGSAWIEVVNLLLGRRPLQEGKRTWPGLGARRPEDFLEYVPFTEHSRAFTPGDYFLGQRYHAGWSDEGPSAGSFIGNVDQSLAERLEIQPLLDRSLITLSSGQMRRVRLARALARKPDALILEDPLAGLDAERRERVASVILEAATSGMAVVVLVAQQKDFPGTAHRYTLNDGHFESQVRAVGTDSRRAVDSVMPDVHSGEPVLSFNNVTVRYGNSTIIDHFTWTVRRGERWRLTGSNGAGKSTLLALAWGDHPQVFGNDIQLFGRRRGEGQTLWEAREPISWHAPELHAHYQEYLTVRQTITTGITGSFTPPPSNRIDHERLEALIRHFALNTVADSPYRQLPAPVQRVVLMARALMKKSDLILLDEPHQGLDGPDRQRVNQWLESNLEAKQALIFATHESADQPIWLNRTLNLDAPAT
jgi:molybdate transport system ATP-binding protein